MGKGAQHHVGDGPFFIIGWYDYRYSAALIHLTHMGIQNVFGAPSDWDLQLALMGRIYLLSSRTCDIPVSLAGNLAACDARHDTVRPTHNAY